MRDILKSWIKSFMFVVFLGICTNVLYLAVPLYMMVTYENSLYSFSMATLATLGVGVLISLILYGILEYFRSKLLILIANGFALKMAPFVVQGLHKDAVSLERQGYTRGIQDLAMVRNALVQSGGMVHALDLPWILIYLAVLYLMHPLLCAVALLGTFLVIMFQWLLKVLGEKRYTTAEVTLNSESKFIYSTLQGAELVSGMGMLPGIIKRFDTAFFHFLGIMTEIDNYKAFTGAFIRTLQVVFPAAVFAAGTYLFFEGDLSAGVLFAGVVVVFRIFYPFGSYLDGMKQAIDALAAYKRLKNYVDTTKSKPPLPLPEPKGKISVEGIALKIRERVILNNISFGLEPGEILGIAGPSSSGKSSLCKTILGIWPAFMGKIRLDGAELSQWDRDELGQYIGYLPQEPELFSGTIAENVARMQAAEPEKVIQACRKTGIHDMILKLPAGYDTRIDQTGKNLSAGQRQLISLARAVYGNPKFIVMDDPQTFLDESGFVALANTLNTLRNEKTTMVLVTDKPNLLMATDKILIIREGQVAMYGPSKEIIAQIAKTQKAQ